MSLGYFPDYDILCLSPGIFPGSSIVEGDSKNTPPRQVFVALSSALTLWIARLSSNAYGLGQSYHVPLFVELA